MGFLRFWSLGYGFGYEKSIGIASVIESFMQACECRYLILPITFRRLDVSITAFIPSNIAFVSFSILLSKLTLSNNC